MSSRVNADPRAARAARVAVTEDRLVAAATELFLRHGYVGTTLTAVAERAGVAARTVYLRFSTKAALLRRVMDVAVVGDTAPVDLAHRDWATRALSAATLDERLALAAAGARDIMSRLGPLLPVAQDAASLEPDIAAAAIAAREATRDQLREFWHRAAADGLLPASTDLNWLADTAAVLGSADTYLLGTRILEWTPESYEQWLLRTWRVLLAAPPA